jgi:hypothetical protein
MFSASSGGACKRGGALGLSAWVARDRCGLMLGLRGSSFSNKTELLVLALRHQAAERHRFLDLGKPGKALNLLVGLQQGRRQDVNGVDSDIRIALELKISRN